jgi:hypothetical protein
MVIIVIWLLASVHTQRIAYKKAASPSENNLQKSIITIKMASMHVTPQTNNKYKGHPPNKQQI